jgi:hypothetical protein
MYAAGKAPGQTTRADSARGSEGSHVDDDVAASASAKDPNWEGAQRLLTQAALEGGRSTGVPQSSVTQMTCNCPGVITIILCEINLLPTSIEHLYQLEYSCPGVTYTHHVHIQSEASPLGKHSPRCARSSLTI